MTSDETSKARTGGGWIGVLLLAFALLPLSAVPALAQSVDCVGDAGGIIDGFVNYPIPPAQINIDGPCTIRNYTASNPLTSNISWFGSLPGSTLLIFDNVVHTGNMSCNLPSQGNLIWFVNSASTTVQDNCLSLLIPVEKIDKQNPPGPPFVTIGVPFTWTLTIPVLFDPATGTVINNQGSVNDLHSITVVDDLNATGVDLTYVSHTVTWLDDGTAVPHTFSNVANVLTFDNIPIVDAGRQFVIALTLVLDNTPTNSPGTPFINTAKWDFGRLIDGTFYEPLPGEWGVTPPLTIDGPELTVDKTGPATMNIGLWGTFALDVQNIGLTDAWDVHLQDLLPDGPTGGMCDLAPQILSAQVFAADGVTPVPGKGPLVAGTDYSLTWSGAPACQLDITMLTAAARIGLNERLIVQYRTQLDSGTQNGVALTNFAGAIQWFNGDSSNPNRVVTNEMITDGTIGTLDHEDAHTVSTNLTGTFFEKTVANLRTGANPTTTAVPGDTLRYTLRFQTTDQPLAGFRIVDEMDALNVPPAFAAGTLALVTVPAGADVSGTNSTGGASGTGVLDVGNLSLPVNSQLLIQFDITLKPALANGTVVADQATLRLGNGTTFALSDDPNVNGIADPLVAGDEDPTRVTIASAAGFRIQKISTDLTGDPNVLLAGETLRYTITVANLGTEDAVNVTLRDAIPANTTYVAGSTTLNGTAVPDVAGTSALVGGMLIHPPSDPTPGSMPADASAPAANVATIIFDVVVSPTVPNGTILSNQGFVTAAGSGIVDRPSDDPATPAADDPTLDVVGNFPLLYAEKSAGLSVDLGTPGVVDPGDTLRYTITIQNSAAIPATGVVLTDSVPANTTYVANSTQLNGSPYGQPDGGVAPLASGINVGTIAPGATAVVQFDLQVNAGTPAGTLISNQAVVASVELPDLLTDGDGNPGTGPEPTVVVVGGGTQLSITKQVTVVGGGAALPGSTLDYVIRVTNITPNPALNVVITDTLPAGQLAYVPASATMNGSAAGVSVAGATITADYAAVYGPLNPGEVVVLTFRAILDPGLANGTVVTNTGVVAWDTPTQTASASVSITVGGIAGLYFFEKTVANLTTGANPATTAVPGDTLRYTLRYQTTDQALAGFRIVDEMDALNAPPAFAAGTLTLVSYPAGADISGTNSTGGASGTGVLDVGNLSLPVNSQLLIQFDITLRPALANSSVVEDQATLRLGNGAAVALSDDPNVNGAADPLVAGDEDPTRVTIVSAPSFRIQKISTDLTGDPNVLLAGETLRYTITVVNIGTENAVNVTLRDAVPVNTTYVAGSTTLNGAAVPDVAGLSPLVSGMFIHPPSDPTPGSMPADASGPPANVATITFNVVVDPAVVDGTVISNQGFVTAAGSGIVDQPSDDPDTPIVNDPTRDIVGNFPLLYAEKSVALSVDLGTPGIVDPGDTLHYTITVQNSAAIPATGVVLTDPVPANTTYVADSTQLNGSPYGQPDGGVSPLASGINVGTIAPGGTAVLQFDLLVTLGTPAGTLISNQAVVGSVELPDLLTDGDGNPATGPEPTVVVVGAGQQLSITKQVSVVGGGPAIPGAQVDYVVRVTNIASVPALNVVITDDLDASGPGQLAYVGGSATMNGSAAGVSFAGSTITADYAAVNGPLNPGEVVVLRFRATLDPGLANGTVVTNTGVVAWSLPTQTASASVSITVGGIPGFGVLNGSAWHDANFDNTRDSGERALAGWAVELYRDGVLVHTALTDANGDYRISGVEPNDVTGSEYELRFRAPGAGLNTAMLGLADAPPPSTVGLQRIADIVVTSGANLQGLNLPIDPNGVVYNSLARIPVVGATLTLLDAVSGSPVPAACFDDQAQQGQITLADGYYKFNLNFSDPACPRGGDYLIEVTPPLGTFLAGTSQIIPPPPADATTAFSVPLCPGDAVPGTTHCEVQGSEFQPGAAVPALGPGTVYHVHLTLDDPQPESSQIFNNHIPLDPVVNGAIAISKTTPLLDVTRGQLVPYVITVNNVAGLLLTDVSVVDRYPAGFTYVEGSALLDGVPIEPSVVGGELRWTSLVIAGTQVRTLKLLLAVGAGVTEGEYVNRAQVVQGVTGSALSGEATATVRVMPDPTFDCTDVTGKVFNDANRNGRQDVGEDGLPGVRLVTARGLQATTDEYGRYHITCAIVPNEIRGSNFVLKLDERTLPSGFRMSTDPLQIKRATRGKALKVNFGASIHRVVAIDLSDPAFEPGSTEIRAQWRPRLDLLLEELRKAPSVLRLSYVADTEDEALVERRVEAVKRQLADAWDAANPGYQLTIEPEVFWRRGVPLKQRDVRVPGGR
jgi:uncharacterized repeat protein (TIGR01451 family)